MDSAKYLSDRFLEWMKGHRIPAALMLFGTATVALATFTTAIDDIVTFYQEYATSPTSENEELVALLELRYQNILANFPDTSFHPKLENLHQQTVSALRDGKTILAHELIGKTHQLLANESVPNVLYGPALGLIGSIKGLNGINGIKID